MKIIIVFFKDKDMGLPNPPVLWVLKPQTYEQSFHTPILYQLAPSLLLGFRLFVLLLLFLLLLFPMSQISADSIYIEYRIRFWGTGYKYNID